MNSPNAIDETLCAEHWRQLKAHAMSLGHSEGAASDAVQETFLQMIKNGAYERNQARALPLLRNTLKWVLANAYVKARTLKRGGANWHESLDDPDALLQVAGGETPEALYDRSLLAAELVAAGVTDETMWPGPLTNTQKVTRWRWKKTLRRRFEHFLS